MRIVIIGDGKVGYTLTKQLSEEGHDVTVIDSNAKVLEQSQEELDVMVLQGNGASISAQTEAGVANADFLIAATSQDEVNLLCCVLAKKLGCRHTIARVRNPEYEQQARFLKEELGLSMTINPERTTAHEIYRLLELTAFSKRESFAKRRVELVELKVQPHCPLVGRRLYQLSGVTKVRMLICVAERDGETFIPSGDFMIQAGDRLTITAAMQDLGVLAKDLGIENQKVKNVMIVGGSRIAVYLAKLLGSRVKVTIIEQRPERCDQLDDLLPHALVINGDGSLPEFLISQGITEADALVTLTGIDEENLVISMCANSLGVQKCITKINRVMYNPIFQDKGIDTMISPKLLTANEIVGYVRAADHAPGEGVMALHRLGDGQTEAIEFHVDKAFPYLEVALSELPLRKNTLIACIIRGGREVIIPSGNDVIRANDTIIAVADKMLAISELTGLLALDKRGEE